MTECVQKDTLRLSVGFRASQALICWRLHVVRSRAEAVLQPCRTTPSSESSVVDLVPLSACFLRDIAPVRADGSISRKSGDCTLSCVLQMTSPQRLSSSKLWAALPSPRCLFWLEYLLYPHSPGVRSAMQKCDWKGSNAEIPVRSTTDDPDRIRSSRASVKALEPPPGQNAC